jgi:hypothetical protein
MLLYALMVSPKDSMVLFEDLVVLEDWAGKVI